MPRHVDHEQRRRDIVRAGSKLLATQGLKGVTFAAVATELGGSTTLVTHYYRTIAELLKDIAAGAVLQWEAEVDEIMRAHPDNPSEQLRSVLFEWLIPIEGKAFAQELVRYNLLGARALDDGTQQLLDTWEAGMRELFLRCVRPLVETERVEVVADVLRVTFNGLSLSTVEHQDYWTAARQRAVFETVAQGIGLLAPPARECDVPA